MSETVRYRQIEEKIITIRDLPVILDSDVAILYDVATKEVNQAVKNNSKKFPKGYILDVTDDEFKCLRSKILTLETTGRGKHTKYLPKAFTEKGLYMLATILKGEKATQTAIEIIEVFAKIRELSRTIAELSESPDEPA